MRTGVAPTLLILALTGVAYAQAPDPTEVARATANFKAADLERRMNRGEIPRGSTVDVNKGLSSSSRTYTGDERDGFDLGKPSGKSSVVFGAKDNSGPSTARRADSRTLAPSTASSPSDSSAPVKSSSGGGGVLYFAVRGKAGPVYEDASFEHEDSRPLAVPDIYLVRKGDTLWGLSDRYYRNPWGWPTVWSLNPQVVNPHWIYPGDQLRLKAPGAVAGSASRSLPARGFSSSEKPALRPHVLPKTVFSRDQGYLGDPKRDFWGELVGAAEDQMLLANGNHAYLTLRPGVTLEPGQTLTIFTPLRSPDDVPGARKPPGEIVSIKGTIKIDQFNPKTRVARGRIVEALDVIERGAKVGPVRRNFDVVAPRPATKEVVAHVLTSFYPRELFGQHQLLFLDRGSEDGLEPGTRLFVLAQGDTWRRSFNVATGMLQDRIRLESNKLEIERTPTRGADPQFPNEVMAELRVLRTEKYSSVALVLEAKRELSAGDVASSLVGH